MLERIDLIIKKLGISASQFAEEINVQRSSVSHVLSGRNKPSLDFITKVITRYPEINAEWLLSGRGQMYSAMNVAEKTDSVSQEGQVELDIQGLEESERGVSWTKQDDKTAAKSIKRAGKQVSTSGHGSIKKIVFFYEDGHFREYIPGDD
jgi:transcriptional regulator with XRE-family HTH domain